MSGWAREEGRLDPNGLLTRQEAAVFLARTYEAYGGEFTVPDNGPAYTDWDEVDIWAKDSVAFLSGAGVMQGYEDGRFCPKEFYTYEQCIISLLRLHENMPCR